MRKIITQVEFWKLHQNNCVELDTVQNEHLVANFRFDTADNDFSESEILTISAI